MLFDIWDKWHDDRGCVLYPFDCYYEFADRAFGDMTNCIEAETSSKIVFLRLITEDKFTEAELCNKIEQIDNLLNSWKGTIKWINFSNDNEIDYPIRILGMSSWGKWVNEERNKRKSCFASCSIKIEWLG